MRFYWLQDKKIQKKFDMFWDKSKNNKADYHTKHHVKKHHHEIRKEYVWDRPINFDQDTTNGSQGCVGVQHWTPDGRPRMTSAKVNDSEEKRPKTII